MLTTYTYDKNNRVTSITHPEVEPGQTPLATESFGYDKMGNLLWKRYGSEPATVYEYDELNRLTHMWYSFSGALEVPLAYPSANPDVEYTYDGGSRLRSTVTNLYDGVNSYVSQYTYDLMDRLETYTPPLPSGHGAITYEYNALGQKTSVTNGSVAVNYDYYANGWLKRVRRGESLVSKYTYDASGNRTRTDLGNMDYTTYTYDADPRYRVDSVMHRDSAGTLLVTPGILYDSRDGAGNPLSMQDWNGTATYAYDMYSRLGSITDYDQVGNRYAGTWSYNAVDQLIATGSNKYDYLMTGSLANKLNAAGTLVEKSYSYSYANLLTGVTNYEQGIPTSNSSMAWDGDSNRISFTSSQSGVGTTQFVYDTTAGIPAVIEEVLPSTQSVYYIREPNGALIARMAGTTGANTRYYHFDALGSTRLLTDSTGAVTDKYTYDAWGALTNHEQLTGSVDQPYQFVGQLGYYTHYQDSNLPMLHLGVRFYDPALGRFTQEDPLDTLHRLKLSQYKYVRDCPLSLADPTGLSGQRPGSGNNPWDYFADQMQEMWGEMCFDGVDQWLSCLEKCAEDAAMPGLPDLINKGIGKANGYFGPRIKWPSGRPPKGFPFDPDYWKKCTLCKKGMGTPGPLPWRKMTKGIGKVVPIIGWAITIKDAYDLGKCVKDCNRKYPDAPHWLTSF